MEEKLRQEQILAERYESEKRELQQKREDLNDKLLKFRREAEQVVNKVMYLTKNDDWDRKKFYRTVELCEERVRRAARRYAQQLDETERELTVSYRKKLENLSDKEG